EKIPLPFFAMSLSLSPGSYLLAVGFAGLHRPPGCSSPPPATRSWCGRSLAAEMQQGLWCWASRLVTSGTWTQAWQRSQAVNGLMLGQARIHVNCLEQAVVNLAT
ncbi:WDR90 isoform 7, partial [Pongo abelii]